MSNSTHSAAESAPRPGGTGRLGEQTVARVGYGAMQLARLREDRDTALAILRRAVELGVDHVDTAQFYGNGFVNGLIRDALRPEDGVTIVSKVGATPDPGGPMPMRAAQRPEELRAGVEDNLRALGLEQIPVVNLRRIGEGTPASPGGDQVVDFDDQVDAMVRMRDEGLIGGIGLSTVTLDQLRRAVPAGIVCMQNAYSLVDRRDEPLLELCEAEDIAWVPYFPLGSAVPAFPKVTGQSAVREVADALGHDPAQVGLAWLLHHSPRTLLIPGTASLGHLDDNVAVGGIELDEKAMATLDTMPSVEVGPIG